MRRIITSTAVWLVVTAAAVALSWWGVRSVLRDTVFQPPRPPVVAADGAPGPAVSGGPVDTGVPGGPGLISATSRPAPSATGGATGTGAPQGFRPQSSPQSRTPTPPSTHSGSVTAEGGTGIQNFQLRGGRAAFRFDALSASLVTATPKSGWAVKVWPGDRWMRVDFTSGDRTSSVIVAWNGHAPLASTYEE